MDPTSFLVGAMLLLVFIVLGYIVYLDSKATQQVKDNHWYSGRSLKEIHEEKKRPGIYMHESINTQVIHKPIKKKEEVVRIEKPKEIFTSLEEKENYTL